MKLARRLATAPALVLLLAVCGGAEDCNEGNSQSDLQQRAAQEVILQEATAATGMPAIKNFRERKLLKDILELRDQAGLTTYTYVWAEMKGSLVYLCDSIGYGIPYATEFTNPQKTVEGRTTGEFTAIPQADPNGLFSPPGAEGTWVMCKDPHGDAVKPLYIEPRIVVSPFRLRADYAAKD